MNRIFNFSKHIINSVMFLTILSAPLISQAEVINDSHWRVSPGENLYTIARKILPNDTRQQTRLRKELMAANPEIFAQGANKMRVGSQLIIPQFALPKKPLIKTSRKTVATVSKTKPAVSVVTPDPQDSIGRVIVNSGELEAENRGSVRKLTRHSTIFKGDTLKTAANASSQIRLKDGALISLSADTQFKISEYNFNGKQDGSEKSIFDLIKGGFRTITGLIGHKNKRNYQVKTSFATIGIRGTHYGLMLCNAGSCEKEEGLKDGLYGGVVDGSIITENQSGQHQFTNDQYFHIASFNAAPVQTLKPPQIFKNKRKKKGEHKKLAKLKSKIQGFIKPPLDNFNSDRPPLPPQPVLSELIPDNVPAAQAGSGYLYAFNGPANGVFTGSAISTIDSSDNILIIPQTDPDPTKMQILAFAAHETSALPSQLTRDIVANVSNITPATLLDNDSLKQFSALTPTTSTVIAKVQWGRWDKANVAVLESGRPILHNDLHFVFSPDLTSKDRLLNTITGTKTYSGIVGYTAATNSLGQSAAAAPSIVVDADFTNKNFDYDVSTTIGTVAAITYAGSATGVSFSNLGTGFTISEAAGARCGSTASCGGQVNMNFIGDNAEGLITAYTIRNTEGLGSVASGTAVVAQSGN